MNRNLTVSKKSGFKVNDINVPINIRDERGILFYTTEPIMPVVSFNLPAGNYLVDSGSFSLMSQPINFKLASLPLPEVAVPISPVNFKITFGDNPNKCTIFWSKKMIVFDNSFIDAPLPQFYFILFHEYGHAYYGYDKIYSMKQSEAYCDLFASNEMLKMGFNPSQISNAPKDTLSSKQDYRKEFIRNTLLSNA